MGCSGCARRARRLFKWLDLDYKRVGPNHRAQWMFETPDVALLVPTLTVAHKTSRATILVLVARLLFGSSKAREAPTPTEVWRLPSMHPDDLARFHRDEVIKRFRRSGTTIQTWNSDYVMEIRRAPWLRLVGAIDEKLMETEDTSVTNESVN